VSCQYNDEHRSEPLQCGSQLSEPDYGGSVRHRDMQSGSRFCVPEGCDYGYLYLNGRTDLFVHGDGE